MKKINTNLLFNILIIIMISMLVILLFAFHKMMEPVKIHVEKTPISAIVVYDEPNNWITVTADPLEPRDSIVEDLGNYIGIDTFGCYFIASDMLGYPIDVDDFYWTMFDQEEGEANSYEGKINPDLLYEYSLGYIAANDFNYGIENISDEDLNYIFLAGRNNYPIIVWLEGQSWTEAIPYVIYKIDDENVYMINTYSRTTMSRNMFIDKWNAMQEHYALIYGNYWS